MGLHVLYPNMLRTAGVQGINVQKNITSINIYYNT